MSAHDDDIHGLPKVTRLSRGSTKLLEVTLEMANQTADKTLSSLDRDTYKIIFCAFAEIFGESNSRYFRDGRDYTRVPIASRKIATIISAARIFTRQESSRLYHSRRRYDSAGKYTLSQVHPVHSNEPVGDLMPPIAIWHDFSCGTRSPGETITAITTVIIVIIAITSL